MYNFTFEITLLSSPLFTYVHLHHNNMLKLNLNHELSSMSSTTGKGSYQGLFYVRTLWHTSSYTFPLQNCKLTH